MAGPRDKGEQAAAAPKAAQAPQQAISNYYFTFGGTHVLRHGRVLLADSRHGGLPLAGFFVLIHASSPERARGAMVEAFGEAWDGMYVDEAGSHMVRRHGLRALFDTGPTTAMGELGVAR
jgi:hypothetical protein